MTEADPLAALRARFKARCLDDLAVLVAARADPALRSQEALRTTVHRLSGAAGTFGYPVVSEVAGELDQDLHDGRPVDADRLDLLIAAVSAMEHGDPA